MSKIKNGGLDQYGAGSFKQQQLGTAGGEGVNNLLFMFTTYKLKWPRREQSHIKASASPGVVPNAGPLQAYNQLTDG